MNDETKQQISQLVEHLANETEALKGEMDAIKGSITGLEARFDDPEASLGRFEAAVVRPVSLKVGLGDFIAPRVATRNQTRRSL